MLDREAQSSGEISDTSGQQLDPREAISIGETVIYPEGLNFLNKVAGTSDTGLEVPQGINRENLHGGLLGFWGLVESIEGDGRVTYRLPAEAVVDISEALRYGELGRVKNELEYRGFALSSFRALGLSNASFDFSNHLLTHYFNAGLLQQCEGDRPKDRKRARGVTYFSNMLSVPDMLSFNAGSMQRGGSISVGEYPDRSVPPRKDDNILKRVEYPYIRVADDDGIRTYSACLAALSGKMFGTVGINMFEAKTQIVETTHQDNVEIAAIAVLDVEGNGAKSLLYENNNGNRGGLILRQRLERGDVLFFKDRMFFHSAEPLIPRFPGNITLRRTLVATAKEENWSQKLPMLLRNQT